MFKKFFGLILSLLLFLTACGSSAPKEFDNEEISKMKVITTIFPLYEFAREVGKDYADIDLLLPPGTEPHTFDPSPGDIIKISEADIFIYIGADMEPWVTDVLDGVENNELVVLEAVEFVDLLEEGSFDPVDLALPGSSRAETEETNDEHEHEHEHGDFDPHIWLDFDNDKKLVDAILDIFIKEDPDNKEFYEENAGKYKEKLTELDNEYNSALSNCMKDTFITGGHNAYAYLAQKYNLHYLSAYGVSPDSEPTPKAIKEITDSLKETGIKYVLFEELVSPRLAEVIADEADAEILVFNPGANLTKKEFDSGLTFITLMNENIENLKKALECQ